MEITVEVLEQELSTLQKQQTQFQQAAMQANGACQALEQLLVLARQEPEAVETREEPEADGESNLMAARAKDPWATTKPCEAADGEGQPEQD